MKNTSVKKIARFAGIAVAGALFMFASSDLQGQEKGSAKGGASLLMKAIPPASGPAYVPMSCARCKSEFTRRAEVTTKGTRPNTYLVERHLCTGCDTTIATVGHGKAKRDVATHKCTSCGEVNLACCNTRKSNAVATKGMEKTFEIAPLK